MVQPSHVRNFTAKLHHYICFVDSIIAKIKHIVLICSKFKYFRLHILFVSILIQYTYRSVSLGLRSDRKCSHFDMQRYQHAIKMNFIVYCVEHRVEHAECIFVQYIYLVREVLCGVKRDSILNQHLAESVTITNMEHCCYISK